MKADAAVRAADKNAGKSDAETQSDVDYVKNQWQEKINSLQTKASTFNTETIKSAYKAALDKSVPDMQQSMTFSPVRLRF